jgi:hypothetical protein
MMKRYLSHALEMGGHETIEHEAKSFLAIVDLESYPSLDDRKADHLDVLSHVCGQAQALTAVMWETPSDTLKLKLVLTDTSRLSQELTRTHRLVFDGCVRTTTGQLCLTDDEQILVGARRGDRDLLHGKAATETRCPRLLNVPPGVINVGVFCERSTGFSIPELDHAKVDYTILMRHYPLPPPRVAPVRLTGGLIPWAGEEAAGEAWGGRHAA